MMRVKNLIVIVGLIAILALLLLQKDWTLRMVDNLAYMVWRFWLIVKAFDRKLLWALFSIALFILLSVRIAKEIKIANYTSKASPNNLSHNNIEKWTGVFYKALKKKDNYAKWTLAESLFGLYASIYYERFGVNQRQLKNLLRKDELDVPAEIKRYLLAGCGPHSAVESGSIFSINRSAFPLEMDPEKVVKYIEELYERDF